MPRALKRLVTRTDDNGNLGREFVKCLSKTMARSDGKGRNLGAQFGQGAADGEFGELGQRGGQSRATVRYARNAELHLESELTGELKKIKKNLMEMIDL
ncbi:hypothetical protein D1007_10606 [Hordeum vulgare]|nr:hypothetical protein D1007_10606 [Hordeum vulgare]